MAASAPQPAPFTIRGPVSRTDLPGLCRRIDALRESTGAIVVICDVSRVGVDIAAIEVLARLQLAARRYGYEVRLRRASPQLLELVAFVGMSDVLLG